MLSSYFSSRAMLAKLIDSDSHFPVLMGSNSLADHRSFAKSIAFIVNAASKMEHSLDELHRQGMKRLESVRERNGGGGEEAADGGRKETIRRRLEEDGRGR